MYRFSAYNDRTKCYKNHKFDMLFDTEASQGQVFADCGVPNLLKQVVNVSAKSLFDASLGVQLDDLRVRADRLGQDLHDGGLQVQHKQ